MNHLTVFLAQKELIAKYGIGNAHLLWVMGLYLDETNLDELAADCLTDGGNDKKIDFINLNRDNKKIVFAQGYYTEKGKSDEAPANKASDLNTAAAWLLSGDLSVVPKNLKLIIEDCRKAIADDDIDKIELLYVHNLPQSVNVERELITAKEHLTKLVQRHKPILVFARELGNSAIEELYIEQSSQIAVLENIDCPAEIKYVETGEKWSAGILSVPAAWLKLMYMTKGDKLFSANYRGFLGLSKRKKKDINSDIKSTAEKQPTNFWAFNNGITILTNNYQSKAGVTSLSGISIINGAQTTGSLSLIDDESLKNVKVMARIVKCTDSSTIDDIIKFNNTQNEITSWDKFSNDAIQKSIAEELKKYGHDYNLKRSSDNEGEVGIANVIQPLVSLMGYYSEANRGKNGLFLSPLYKLAFEHTKARHILFAYCLNQAFDFIRNDLKKKRTEGKLISIEEMQLELLQNLRFKYFFIAIFSGCCEVLLGKKVISPKSICFANSESSQPLNTLIVSLIDVVILVLNYVEANIDGKFSEVYEKPEVLDTLTKLVSRTIQANKPDTNEIILKFRKIVECD